MIGFLNSLNCLEVVFNNYYDCECSYLVNFDLFPCTDKMICLVPVLLWFILVVLLFLSAFSNAMSVSLEIVTAIFK